MKSATTLSTCLTGIMHSKLILFSIYKQENNASGECQVHAAHEFLIDIHKAIRNTYIFSVY